MLFAGNEKARAGSANAAQYSPGLKRKLSSDNDVSAGPSAVPEPQTKRSRFGAWLMAPVNAVGSVLAASKNVAMRVVRKEVVAPSSAPSGVGRPIAVPTSVASSGSLREIDVASFPGAVAMSAAAGQLLTPPVVVPIVVGSSQPLREIDISSFQEPTVKNAFTGTQVTPPAKKPHYGGTHTMFEQSVECMPEDLGSHAAFLGHSTVQPSDGLAHILTEPNPMAFEARATLDSSVCKTGGLTVNEPNGAVVPADAPPAACDGAKRFVTKSLRLEPEGKLSFSGSTIEIVKMINTSSEPLLMKVKTTAPNCYLVQPVFSLLEPHGEADVKIKLSHGAPSSKHKFLVEAVHVPPAEVHSRSSSTCAFPHWWKDLTSPSSENAALPKQAYRIGVDA